MVGQAILDFQSISQNAPTCVSRSGQDTHTIDRFQLWRSIPITKQRKLTQPVELSSPLFLLSLFTVKGHRSNRFWSRKKEREKSVDHRQVKLRVRRASFHHSTFARAQQIASAPLRYRNLMARTLSVNCIRMLDLQMQTILV